MQILTTLDAREIQAKELSPSKGSESNDGAWGDFSAGSQNRSAR